MNDREKGEREQLKILTENTLFVMVHVELGGQSHFNTRTVTAHLVTQVNRAQTLYGAKCELTDSDKPANQMYIAPDGPKPWNEADVREFLGQCRRLPSQALFASLCLDDPTSAVRVVLSELSLRESRMVDPGLRTMLDLSVIYGALIPPISKGGGCGEGVLFFRRFDALRKCFERQWAHDISATRKLHM